MPFTVGTSGNPSGRPKGRGRRTNLLAAITQESRQAILDGAIKDAMAGDNEMRKFLLSRFLPPTPKDEPLPEFDLSGTVDEQSTKVMLGLREGYIDPTQAKLLMDIIAAHRENIDTAHYEALAAKLIAAGII